MAITATFIGALHRLEESSNVDMIASLFAHDAALSNPLVVHSGSEYRKAFLESLP